VLIRVIYEKMDRMGGIISQEKVRNKGIKMDIVKWIKGYKFKERRMEVKRDVRKCIKV
jgi:hypothetical protein